MVETVIFNGITYRRYPDAERESDRTYFRAGINDQQRYGVRLLHRDVWTYYNGPIPEGYEIHHKDENPANNDISNLECLSMEEHHKKHPFKGGHVFTKEDYDKAAAWHKSAEGHKWRNQFRWEYVRQCPWCDKEFVTKPGESGGHSDNKGKKFCCRSHSATYNNAVRRGRVQPISDWDAYILCKRHPST